MPQLPPKIKLAEAHKIWLNAILSKLQSNEPVDSRTLRVELLGKLPNNFKPSEIDSRLLRSDVNITILGVALLAPDSEIVQQTDQVIQSIRKILLQNPKSTVIDVDKVAQSTGISKGRIAEIFERLSYLGIFHNSGTTYVEDGARIDWGTINIDENAFNGFMSYETMRDVIEHLVDEASLTLEPSSPAIPSELGTDINKPTSGTTEEIDLTPLNQLRNVSSINYLRKRLTGEQRTLIDTIWHYYLDHNQWMPSLVLFQSLQNINVNAVIEELGASFIARGSDPPRKRYRLTILSILLTSEGEALEQLIIDYLRFLKEFLISNPEISLVDSSDVSLSLGISTEQLSMLGRLLRITKFANGGSFGADKWSAGLPVDVEELFSVGDLRSYVEAYALEDLDPDLPMDEMARISYLQNKRTGASPQSINYSRRLTPNLLSRATITPQSTLLRRDPYRLIGTTLAGKYYLEEYAGSGGMGAVYRASQVDTSTEVAVKIFKPDILVKNPRNGILFEREVKAAQKLNHPHIVKLLDSGSDDDDILFMVMEWLDGQTLEDVMTAEHLSIERVTEIFKQICDAVAFAHENNIIHLDIKPANIFMVEDHQPDDFIKVIDFGMARVISSESGTTVTRFLGTYQYCSPEHFGGKVSGRSDIYSLGATLYHMITGVLPFGTSYINAKAHPNLELPPVPSLLNIRPDLPIAIDKVIQKALSKNPKDRQESVRRLFEEVSEALKDTQSVGAPVRSGLLENANKNFHEYQSKDRYKVKLSKFIKHVLTNIVTNFQRFSFKASAIFLLLLISTFGGFYVLRSKYRQNVNEAIPTPNTNVQESVEPISSPIQQPLPSIAAETSSITPSNPAPQTSPTFVQINTRVRGNNTANGWTNTGFVVRRGQRIRISASGRISLGPNRISTPAGISNLSDPNKLMRNEATGGLIAVIGDDNDDFIFIGARREFVAQRDGVLFLGINEGNLNDNTGAYDAVVEAEAVH